MSGKIKFSVYEDPGIMIGFVTDFCTFCIYRGVNHNDKYEFYSIQDRTSDNENFSYYYDFPVFLYWLDERTFTEDEVEMMRDVFDCDICSVKDLLKYFHKLDVIERKEKAEVYNTVFG